MQKRQSNFGGRINNIFPPVSAADSEGLLAWSKNLNSEMLLAAYTQGIFPWPVSEKEVLWFTPPRRAILELSKLHISSSLKRELKKYPFTFEINSRFGEVLEGCANAVRPNQEGTWITPKLKQTYQDFHNLGFVFSFEAITTQNELAGGLYGVWIGGFFAGESMFHRESGASKFALIKTLEWLCDHAGIQWIDIQMMTPLLTRLGAREIDRDEYRIMLKEALSRPVKPEAASRLKTQECYLCNLNV